MAFSFPASLQNDASRPGALAAKKALFGDFGRYAVAPVHTRLGAVEWFVWDAEHPLSTMSRSEVIRQADTLEKAVEGLA